MRKMLFLMTLILGNKTYAHRLEEITHRILPKYEIEPHFLYFDASDYSKYEHSFSKVSKIFLTSFTAYEKHYMNIKKINPDILFFNSWEILPAFFTEIKRIPTVLAHDSTTICNHQLNMLSKMSCLKRIWESLHTRLVKHIYQEIINNVDFFLPWSAWAGVSLEKYFSVAPDKIKVNPAPIDINWWVPPMTRTNSSQRLLFVGNDFQRKGGDFLLDIYSEKLRDFCVLTIVSNDKCFDKMTIPCGVELVRGLTQDRPDKLLEVYQSSDIFVFPTRRDWSSIVSIEAAATGLPVIASSVGGIPEIIQDGQTGYLLPLSAGVNEWEKKIITLIKDRSLRIKMGNLARELVISKFSYEAFSKGFSSAIEHVAEKVDHASFNQDKWN